MDEKLIREVSRELDVQHEDDEEKSKAIISLVTEALAEKVYNSIPYTRRVELYSEAGMIWGMELALRLMRGATIDFHFEVRKCSDDIKAKAEKESKA